MGDLLSKTSSQNPSPISTTSTITSSNFSETRESMPPTEPSVQQEAEISEIPVQESADPHLNQPLGDSGINEDRATKEGEGGEGDEEEEQGECGFCLYMKGGGCRDAFIEWEKCVEEGEEKKEDIVEKCFEVTAALKKCMEAHPDYYGPLLQAEKAAEEEARKQLEKEKESENGTIESGAKLEDFNKEARLSDSEAGKERT